MNLEKLEAWELLQKKLTWKQLGVMEGKIILDFGCGNGTMGAYYANKNTVIAIEPDAQILKDNYYDNVKQICGNINELKKIKNSYFDIILCHNVF